MMPIKVFLADDHAVVRDGLHALLEAESDIMVVGTAPDGRQAVHQVETLCPDIVVMDIAMPRLNGIEATGQINETCPATKVIILSMHSSREHVSRALRAGAKGYLLKESAGKEVARAVRTVHGGSRYLSRRIADMVIDDYVEQHQTETPLELLQQLSSREREIFQLVVEGESSSEIAKVLYLSPKTVQTYRSRLMQKLGIKNLPDLVKFAVRHGVTTLDA
jgi:DNA-binding NarL/FixJ family response regulator